MAGRHSQLNKDGKTIHEDILANIMAFIDDKSDLLAIMRLCRVSYTRGIPFLARIRAESLRQSDLPSFHTFMTRYHDTSFTRLHDLHLDWDGEMTQDQANDLEDLLKGGKAYLKRLLLPCLNQLDAQDGFTRAVASLEELQSLIATSDSSGALRSILWQLPSRLTELSLDLDRERWDGRESHKSHDDPALYISGFASTLKELTLLGTTLPHADTIYPELTELELTFGLAPKLSVLMTALPSLVTLRLNSETIPGNLIIDSDIECRDENIAFQEHGHSWPSLKSFGGDPYSLYLLGLQQEVEVVSIPPGWAICGDDLHQLTSFLPPLRPKSLSLVLSDTEDILSLAFLNGCEKLVELDLGVEFSGEDALTVGESLESLLYETLAHCRELRVLSLTLGVYLEGGRPRVARNVLRRLDIEDFGRRVENLLPRLERMVLTIKDVTTADTSDPGRTWRWEVATGGP